MLLIHWKILGSDSLNISYCNKTMMWFDTSAVASAPSLTFFISGGPSVTVAIAVSWNKTFQLKLYTKAGVIGSWLRGRPFAFGRMGGGTFSQTSGDSFFLTYMGVRFFPADAMNFFFLQCRNFFLARHFLARFLSLEISLQNIIFSWNHPYLPPPSPSKVKRSASLTGVKLWLE